MSTEERASEPMLLYGRVLGLRRLRVGSLASFVFLECTIAAGVLLALAELVSWWAVPVLPVLVASVVKINDLVGAPRPMAGRPALADYSHLGGGGRRGRGGVAEDDGFDYLRFDDYRPTASGYEQLGEAETVRRGVVVRAPGVPAARTAAGAGVRGGMRGQVLSGGGLVERDGELAEEPTRRNRRHGSGAAQAPAGGSRPDPERAERERAERERAERERAERERAERERAELGRRVEPVVPATGRPTTRAHVIGAAVRRSIAVQSQYGRTPATQLSGRHARQEAGVGRRSGTNERGFGRLA